MRRSVELTRKQEHEIAYPPNDSIRIWKSSFGKWIAWFPKGTSDEVREKVMRALESLP